VDTRGDHHQALEPVAAGVAGDRAGLAGRAVAAAPQVNDRARGHAELCERRERQVVVLRQKHASRVERRVAAASLLARDDDARRDPGVVEVGRLERAVRDRARQDDDRVGRARQRIGHEEQAAGVEERGGRGPEGGEHDAEQASADGCSPRPRHGGARHSQRASESPDRAAEPQRTRMITHALAPRPTV
jgi:hypothetical protein